jgi:hypothetical protein
LIRVGRIPQHGEPGKIWNHFPDQLEPLSLQFGRDRGQPGGVSARPRDARDEPRADGIADGHHDERERRRDFCDRERSGCPRGHDHIDVRRDQLGNEGGKSLVFSFRPTILDRDISPFQIPEFTQAFAECPDEIGLQARSGVPEKTYPRNLADFLRGRGRRFGESRDSQQRKELPPFHWITSSAQPNFPAGKRGPAPRRHRGSIGTREGLSRPVLRIVRTVLPPPVAFSVLILYRTSPRSMLAARAGAPGQSASARIQFSSSMRSAATKASGWSSIT